MTTALARVDELTDERVALLKRTLCPDLSNDEMELFAGVARRAMLDPFAKQIYAIKRKGKLTIQTGIDGFRVIAARTGELDGQDGPFWCGPDGQWREVWLEAKPPAAAKVVVHRKGCSRPFVGIARWESYCQRYEGRPQGLWATMGDNQLAKCAEALALRKAFPSDLSGLYTADEMDQAGEPEQPAPAVAADPPKALPAPPKDIPIDRSTDEAVRAKFNAKLGDPMNDSAAITALCARKGWAYADLVRDINAKFKTTYSMNRTPWRDIAAGHREEAIKALNKLPDRDSAADLEQLLAAVARAERVEPAAAFQRYQVAAKLPESCIGPADLSAEQLKQACASFRRKLDNLADIAGEGNGA